MPKVRPTGYEVRESAKPHRGKTWRVIGYKDGVRHQYWFTSEKEARADARDRNAELSNYGAKVSLNPADRLEAFRASELLKPFGKTIMDATRFYLEHLNRTAVSVPFMALAAKVREEFVRREKANEVSNRHARTLRETLSKLELKFGGRIVSEITKDEAREWLLSLPLKLKTKNKHRGYASQIFGLAKEFGYAAANPFSEIKKFRERVTKEDEKGTLSAEQTEKLFRAAEPEVIPFLTLSFFCGIRTATIEKMDWSDIRYDEKRVIVPPYHGKKGERYRVTLSENALAWLKPYVKKSGSLLVAATSTNRFSKVKGLPSDVATRNRILKAAEKAGIALPSNVGRNTFISMHVAYHENMYKTALEANNSVAMIKKDYLDIVTREDAAKFWAIFPK